MLPIGYIFALRSYSPHTSPLIASFNPQDPNLHIRAPENLLIPEPAFLQHMNLLPNRNGEILSIISVYMILAFFLAPSVFALVSFPAFQIQAFKNVIIWRKIFYCKKQSILFKVIVTIPDRIVNSVLEFSRNQPLENGSVFPLSLAFAANCHSRPSSSPEAL